VGQRDHVFVPVVRVPEVWDESEDFGRDTVDWGELVPPGPDQAEDFENILLKDVELKRGI